VTDLELHANRRPGRHRPIGRLLHAGDQRRIPLLRKRLVRRLGAVELDGEVEQPPRVRLNPPSAATAPSSPDVCGASTTAADSEADPRIAPGVSRVLAGARTRRPRRARRAAGRAAQSTGSPRAFVRAGSATSRARGTRTQADAARPGRTCRSDLVRDRAASPATDQPRGRRTPEGRTRRSSLLLGIRRSRNRDLASRPARPAESQQQSYNRSPKTSEARPNRGGCGLFPAYACSTRPKSGGVTRHLASPVFVPEHQIGAPIAWPAPAGQLF
jgi:hypothetical protein